MLKTILTIIIVSSFFTIVGVLVPQPLTDNINNAIVYFLSQINQVQVLVNASTIFNCLQILGNYALALAGFIGIRWLVELLGG